MATGALGFLRRPIYRAISIAVTGEGLIHASPRAGKGVGMFAALAHLRGGGFPRPAASVRILAGGR